MNKLLLAFIFGIFLVGVVSADINVTLGAAQSSVGTSRDYACNTTSSATISNISFWANHTGTWHLNQTISSPIPQSGLVAYYPLDSVTDNLSLHNLTNTGVTFTTGKIGNGGDFERGESDHMHTPAMGDLSSMTFCAWVKEETATGQHFIFDRTAPNANMYLAFNADDATFSWAGGSGLGGSSTVNITRDTNWHFICVSGSSTATNKIYYDGADIGFSGTSGITDNTNPEFTLGEYNGGTWFDGMLDEVGFWNRILTQAEITTLYNSGNGQTNYFTTTTSFNTSFSLNSPIPFVWNCNVCNSTGSCAFAATNRSEPNSFIENSRSYNSSTYETAQESFAINISAVGAPITSVKLNYDGVDYTPTQSGSVYSRTLTMPLVSTATVKTFYWKITSGGFEYNSTSSTQTINPIIFTLCNSTYPTKFINFTFKDETTLTAINATIPTSTFIYYLGDGSITRNYSYINNSANISSYSFCTNVNQTFYVDTYIQYTNTGYPQRVYDPGVLTLTNTTTNKVLYLLGSGDGIYVTFQIINSANQVISGVTLNAVRSIGGTDTNVGTGISGADGTITFWLNPDFIHNFTFTKPSYTTYSTSFIPTQTSYTITMNAGGTISGYDFTRGIYYEITPKVGATGELITNTVYAFNFTLNSGYWDVSLWGFNLRLPNGTILASTSSTNNGGFLTLNLNTSNYTRIYMDYYWVIPAPVTFTPTYINETMYWNIFDGTYSGWSIKTFFEDFNRYLTSGLFGIDNFGRYVIIFIVLFLTIGIMSYKYGLTSPTALIGMIFAVIFFFDVVVGLLPTVVNGVPHALTFISFLLLIVVLIREVQT